MMRAGSDTYNGRRTEMTTMSRRNCIQGTIAAMTAGGVPPASAAEPLHTPMRKPFDPHRRGIQLAELFALDEDHKIRLASQIGITHAIVGVSPALSRVPSGRYVETLQKIKHDFQAAGLLFAGVES